jgi:hypothetical protein
LGTGCTGLSLSASASGVHYFFVSFLGVFCLGTGCTGKSLSAPARGDVSGRNAQNIIAPEQEYTKNGVKTINTKISAPEHLLINSNVW